MKQLLLAGWIAAIGVAVAGCDTALEGQYKSYESTTPAAALWPSPDSTDSQTAGYNQAATSVPSTMPDAQY
jgi:hypothetical protein